MTEKQLRIVEEYVDENYFDKKKLLKYIETHTIARNEVFSYIRKNDNRERGCLWLETNKGYEPINMDKFIDRLPFYCYVPNEDEAGDLGCLLSGLYDYQRRGSLEEYSLNHLYEVLEEMLYKFQIPISQIMNYTIDQTGYVNRVDMFFDWYDYLCLSENIFGWEKIPDSFIYSYNMLLEEVGREPIVYEIENTFQGDFFYRCGDKIEFEGTFPSDNQGNPIMRWIGLKISNMDSVSLIGERNKKGRLVVKLLPNTLIYALNCYNSKEDCDTWYQINAGPQLMQFDYTVLRYERNRLNYSQAKVAEAIGTSVRTYQKWESGDTIPDGHNLLRLMNFLDISDVQMLVKYAEE